MRTIFNALLLILSLVSFDLYAQDQKINCRVEVTNIPLFGGSAYCVSSSGYPIQQFVSPSPAQSVTLYQCNPEGCISCKAYPPFFGYDQRTKEVCDYTPKAIPNTKKMLYQPGSGATVWLAELTAAGSSDRDGSIVSYKWIVNGKSYTGKDITLVYQTKPSPGVAINVALTVTDDDGYQDTYVGVLGITSGY